MIRVKATILMLDSMDIISPTMAVDLSKEYWMLYK